MCHSQVQLIARSSVLRQSIRRWNTQRRRGAGSATLSERFFPMSPADWRGGQSRVNINANDGITPLSSQFLPHVGWTAGLGIEKAVGGNWTAKIEYDYIDLARRTYGLGDAMLPDLNVDPRIHVIKVGLNYNLGDTPLWAPSATTAINGMQIPESPDWNVHGQTTLIPQAYPRIRSPYKGANSLPGGGQGRETWTADAFLGWRLWDGGEFYFNPELAQGFGLNTTL